MQGKGIYFISTVNLRYLVDVFLREYTVIGHVKRNNSVSFEELKKSNELYLDYKGRTEIPPKKFVEFS